MAGDDRQGRNVVDRLFRIKLRALPAGAVQNVDDMALDVEQAKLENRKEPARPGANDHRVGGNHLFAHHNRS